MTHSLFPAEPPLRHLHGLRVEPEEARSILRPQRDERLGFGFTLNPYRGCGHACRYCYVREYPSLLHGPEAWGSWCSPKTNAPELLWSQRHRLRGQSVILSTATDPYQPLEQEFRLTRRCLEVLQGCPETRVLIHTRSSLVLQDLNLLKAFGERIQVALSIPTDDDSVRQITEPTTNAIPVRWSTAERLARAGIGVGISATPLLPMVNPATFARRCRDSGARWAWAGRLRLIPDDPFRATLEAQGWMHILEESHPEELRSHLARYFQEALHPRKQSRHLQQDVPPPPRHCCPQHPSLFRGLHA